MDIFFHLSLLNIGDLFYKKIAIISIKKIRGMLFTIKKKRLVNIL